MIQEPEAKELDQEVVEQEVPVDPEIQEDSQTELAPETEPQETAQDPKEDLVVSISGEEPDEDDSKPAPQWVKDVRKRNRDLQR